MAKAFTKEYKTISAVSNKPYTSNKKTAIVYIRLCFFNL